MIESFHNRLKEAVHNELPGVDAQLKMAPLHRPHPDEVIIDGNTRRSGVLLLLYPFNNSVHTVFILRPEYNGVHSGQIALPGGKVEEIDRHIEDTALRETEEEIGVERSQIKTIGQLTELYIPPSDSLVTPTIATIDHRPEFIPDPHEVAAIIESPVDYFLDNAAIGKTDIPVRQGILKDVPYYKLEDKKMWGATAMMISEFTELLKRI